MIEAKPQLLVQNLIGLYTRNPIQSGAIRMFQEIGGPDCTKRALLLRVYMEP